MRLGFDDVQSGDDHGTTAREHRSSAATASPCGPLVWAKRPRVLLNEVCGHESRDSVARVLVRLRRGAGVGKRAERVAWTPPTPSSASPFDMVSSALGQYMPVDGAAAAAGSADPQGDNAARRDVSDNPTPAGQEQILGAVNLDRDLRITRCNLDAPVFAGVEATAGSPFVGLLPPRTYRRSPGACGRSSRPVSRTSPGSSACDAATGRSWWSR